MRGRGRPISAFKPAAGDMAGRAVWLRVIKAVEEIQWAEPGPGEHAN